MRIKLNTIVRMIVVELICLIFVVAHAQDKPAKNPKKFPSFGRVLLLEQTSETSANASIGDLNGDGFPDLVLAKGRHWPLIDRVLLNDGHGRFPNAHNLGDVADRSYSVTLSDIDRDGDLDVVVGNDAPDPKRVYANDGKGNFHVLSTFGSPEWPTRNATVADVNGDGLPDILVANRAEDGKGPNYVCFNKGKGHFDSDCLAFSHESATTITAADMNGDGIVDLIVPNRDGGQSYVYINNGKGTFPTRVPFGPNDAEIRMRVSQAADLNRDDLLDIVVIDERRGALIYFGEKGATFSTGVQISPKGTTPYALTVGDLNGDGLIDIVVGNVEASSAVYFNDGTGRHFTPVAFGDKKGTVYGFAIGDLDGDGVQDIAAARSEAPNVVYFGSLVASGQRTTTMKKTEIAEAAAVIKALMNDWDLVDSSPEVDFLILVSESRDELDFYPKKSLIKMMEQSNLIENMDKEGSSVRQDYVHYEADLDGSVWKKITEAGDIGFHYRVTAEGLKLLRDAPRLTGKPIRKLRSATSPIDIPTKPLSVVTYDRSAIQKLVDGFDQRATALIRAAFFPQNDLDRATPSRLVLSGPKLWKMLEPRAARNGLRPTGSLIRQSYTFGGEGVKSRETAIKIADQPISSNEVQLFWKTVREEFQIDGPVAIRRATSAELSAYPYQEEILDTDFPSPDLVGLTVLFIVDAKKARFMVFVKNVPQDDIEHVAPELSWVEIVSKN